MNTFLIRDTSIDNLSTKFYVLSHESKTKELFIDEVKFVMKILDNVVEMIKAEDDIGPGDIFETNYLTDILILVLNDRFKYTVANSNEIKNIFEIETVSTEKSSGMDQVLERKIINETLYTRTLSMTYEKITKVRTVLNRIK